MSRMPSRGAARDRRRAPARGIEALEPRILLAATLIKDINAVDTFPADVTNVAGTVYFTARDANGAEALERLSGGAVMPLHSFAPLAGRDPSPRSLTAVGTTLYFTASDGVHGRELWKSDGTAAGTAMVKDINPGANDGQVDNLTNVGGTVYFTASDGTHAQVWKSDGTAGGTVPVSSFTATTQGDPAGLTAAGGMLFFTLNAGTQLWESTGSIAGTTLVKGGFIGVTGTPPPPNIVELTPFGSKVLFVADDGTHDKLWVSDGTPAGTSVVQDISPDADRSTYAPPLKPLPVVGGFAYFAVTTNAGSATAPDFQLALWKTDGTPGGTSQVTQIVDFGATRGTAIGFTPAGGNLFFAVQGVGANAATELWRSDGTAAGTTFLRDIDPGSSTSTSYGLGATLNLAAIGGTLYFANRDEAHGVELWRSDGTAAGTALFDDINPGPESSFPQRLTDVNGTLYFSAHNAAGINQLWRSDGTVAGTAAVKTFTPGATQSSSFPYGGTSAGLPGGKLVFSANDGAHGAEPWVSDGTAAGTVLLKDIDPNHSSYPTDFTAVGGTMYFSASDGPTSRGLWKTDGTPGGTSLVMDFANSTILPPTPLGGAVYFGVSTFNAQTSQAQVALYRSDGTAAGTIPIEPTLNLTSYPSNPLTVFGGKLFFSADDGTHGPELWSSDGTPAGATLVKDINPTVGAGSYPSNLTVAGGKLYFSASDGTNGTELWRSDGTTTGTAIVRDLNPGAASSYPSQLTAVGTTLFFTADDGTPGGTGREIWKVDATAPGMVLVANLSSTATGASVKDLTAVNNRLVFSFDDGVHGLEPWVSNGTAAGTMLLRDLNPGPAGSGPHLNASPNVDPTGGVLYFAADDGRHGQEIWRTDGTAAGTALVNDINPGPGASNPVPLLLLNGRLLVAADDGIHGSELMAVDPAGRVPRSTPGDYDGDGKTDLGIYDATTSTLIVAKSNGTGALIQQFGDPSHANIPVTGDYDGDGKTDLGIYDATTSTLIVALSGGGQPLIQQFGDPSHRNIPVAGDYDGDGKTDLGIYDATTSTLIVALSGGGHPLIQQFGDPSHRNIPVVGDYDGDGKADLGIYDATTSTLIVALSGGGQPLIQQFGDPSHRNIPVVGDYDGDGKAELGIFDATTSTLIVALSGGGHPLIQQFGDPSHRNVPVVGDYDGDGKTDLGIYDATTSTLIVAKSNGTGALIQQFGDPSHTNVPVPAAGASGLRTAGAALSVAGPSVSVGAVVIPDTSADATAPVPAARPKAAATVGEAVRARALDDIRAGRS